MIYLLAVLHALVDAACAAKLYSAAGNLSLLQISTWFLLYNLLAFSTQGIIGGVLDAVVQRQTRFSAQVFRKIHGRPNLYVVFAVAGAFIVALGAAIPFPLPVGVCLIGLGNSLFHAGGGGYTLSVSEGMASGIGLFVGPGSLGLVLGILFPQMRLLFVLALIIAGIAAAVMITIRENTRRQNNINIPEDISTDPFFLFRAGGISIQKQVMFSPWVRILVAGMLCLAVAFRAFGGSFPSYPWKTGTAMILTAALFVMAGKIAGGFAYDLFGASKTIVVSSCLAAVIITLFSGNAPASLAGITALNIAMPVTLALLYRTLSRYPAFSFGLAASVLFPGSLLGTMAAGALKKEPAWTKSGLFICCSLAALIFVLISCVMIARADKKKEDFT